VTLGREGPGVLPIERLGTSATHAVPTWVNPDGRPGLSLDAEREIALVRTGWQLIVVASAVAMLAVRFRETDAEVTR